MSRLPKDYQQAHNFYANYRFVNVAAASAPKYDEELGQEWEGDKPAADDAEDDEYPILETYSDTDSVDFNRAIMAITKEEPVSFKKGIFRSYLVLVVFNYSGVNLRSIPLLNVPTERELLHGFNIFDAIDGYDLIQSNSTLDSVAQVVISVVVGLANLIPAKAARPDIGSFISSFMEDDYQIRDCSHTRLKDLSEILGDIKTLSFALLNTDIGTPIIVSTKVPEELRLDPGFIALLSTSTFDSNQVLRYIQIDPDVDSFFVLRNDIAMCHRIEYDAFQHEGLLQAILDHDIHLEVSQQLLELYGGLSLVLLVILFIATIEIQVKLVLLSWLFWPVVAAVVFCRTKSKLASINFFTLDGKDRKYQAFNSICVCNDDIILSKIRTFMFFRALSRFTVQEKFLVHTLLKVVENVNYDWLSVGLKLKDFKRLAGLAVTTYEKDVGIITPNARMYFHAPRKANETCVVCIINVKGE
eukprot:gene24728-27954_t